jgi:hypothetical protein
MHNSAHHSRRHSNLRDFPCSNNGNCVVGERRRGIFDGRHEGILRWGSGKGVFEKGSSGGLYATTSYQAQLFIFESSFCITTAAATALRTHVLCPPPPASSRPHCTPPSLYSTTSVLTILEFHLVALTQAPPPRCSPASPPLALME